MSVQQTLTGKEADARDGKPDTFRWCHECEKWILRTRFESHWDHDRKAQWKAAQADDGDDEGEEDEDPPEQVGAWYDITLSYTVDYRFRVPAWDQHRAEELAKEWHWGAKPADEMHVHTRRDEIKEIYEDDPDLPDDFDMYGSEELWEAFERAKEDGNE